MDTLRATLDGKPEAKPYEDYTCGLCKTWLRHKQAARKARELYQHDANGPCIEGTTIRSVDLQKVIMLPRMPGNKTAIFTRRIVGALQLLMGTTG